MIKIRSEVEGKRYNLFKLKKVLEPLGYTVGGNWDYDHGFMDYKIAEEDGNQYLRIPIQAVEGNLDKENSLVQLGTPFLLSHEYEDEIDEEGNVGTVSASFNQFKAPKDKDAEFPSDLEKTINGLINELEAALLNA